MSGGAPEAPSATASLPPGSSWPGRGGRTPWFSVKRPGWWALCPTRPTATSQTATSFWPPSAQRRCANSPAAWPPASPTYPANTAIRPRPAAGLARSARRTWSSPARNRGCSQPRSHFRNNTPMALRTARGAGAHSSGVSARCARRAGRCRLTRAAAPRRHRIPHLVRGARASGAGRAGPLRDVPEATRRHLEELTFGFIDEGLRMSQPAPGLERPILPGPL